MVKFTKYKWHFYADNNIEQSIVEFLRKSNFDVLWIAEIPNLRKQQEDIFHYLKARKLRRYLLTREPENKQPFGILLKDFFLLKRRIFKKFVVYIIYKVFL